MTPKHPVLYINAGLTNGKAHEYSDEQIHVDIDTLVSFVIEQNRT